MVLVIRHDYSAIQKIIQEDPEILSRPLKKLCEEYFLKTGKTISPSTMGGILKNTPWVSEGRYKPSRSGANAIPVEPIISWCQDNPHLRNLGMSTIAKIYARHAYSHGKTAPSRDWWIRFLRLNPNIWGDNVTEK